MQIHKYAKKDKLCVCVCVQKRGGGLKAVFCSEDEGGDRTTADEMSPPHRPPQWRQMNAKNTDIHMQQLDFGIQSPDCWEVLLLINHLCAPVWEKSSSIIQPVTRSPTDSMGITVNHHNMLQQYHYTMILKYQLQDDLLLRVLMQVAKNK